MKRRRKIITFLTTFILSKLLICQPHLTFLDKKANLDIYGGTHYPNEDLKKTDETGFFAKNGYNIGFNINYVIKYGIFVGFNLEYNHLFFNDKAFKEYSNAETIKARDGFNSTRYGINGGINIPIIIDKETFCISIYGEFNSGFRSFNIPRIDLTYNELLNKYVEVIYRPRGNTLFYYGYSGGINFIFKKKFLVNIAYNNIQPTKHSIRYYTRTSDAFNNIQEYENHLTNYLDSWEIQFGFGFYF
ncbi:MAG: hypothetical protein N3A01_05600 [Bacteroidales bacterium]|nr:hypothetical protein [Bacteroidales bacterium]